MARIVTLPHNTVFGCFWWVGSWRKFTYCRQPPPLIPRVQEKLGCFRQSSKREIGGTKSTKPNQASRFQRPGKSRSWSFLLCCTSTSNCPPAQYGVRPKAAPLGYAAINIFSFHQFSNHDTYNMDMMYIDTNRALRRVRACGVLHIWAPQKPH
jgi:hypothetical protein